MARNISLTIFLTFIELLTAYAQPQPAKPKELSRLMVLSGKWKGNATFRQNGKTYSFIYYADFRPTADSSGIYMEEWFTSDQLGNLMGSNLIGYNSNDHKIHWFSVDNFGTSHDHLGYWKSDGHFYMQAKEIQNKLPFVEKIDLIFSANNSMTLQIVASLGGNEIERVSALFTRIE